MPLPLLWIGGALVGAYLVDKVIDHADQIEQERSKHPQPLPHDVNGKAVAKSPSDILKGEAYTYAEPGTIVCCGIFGLFQHSGIYVGERTIVEMHGSGLIRAVSVERFLHNRSGGEIFIASDSAGNPLVYEPLVIQAAKRIYDVEEYDMIHNNCHQFVFRCLTDRSHSLTSFEELNVEIAAWFNKTVYWDRARFA